MKHKSSIVSCIVCIITAWMIAYSYVINIEIPLIIALLVTGIMIITYIVWIEVSEGDL